MLFLVLYGTELPGTQNWTFNTLREVTMKENASSNLSENLQITDRFYFIYTNQELTVVVSIIAVLPTFLLQAERDVIQHHLQSII